MSPKDVDGMTNSADPDLGQMVQKYWNITVVK